MISCGACGWFILRCRRDPPKSIPPLHALKCRTVYGDFANVDYNGEPRRREPAWRQENFTYSQYLLMKGISDALLANCSATCRHCDYVRSRSTLILKAIYYLELVNLIKAAGNTFRNKFFFFLRVLFLLSISLLSNPPRFFFNLCIAQRLTLFLIPPVRLKSHCGVHYWSDILIRCMTAIWAATETGATSPVLNLPSRSNKKALRMIWYMQPP